MDDSSSTIKSFVVKQLKELYPEKWSPRLEVNKYFLAKAGIRIDYPEELIKNNSSL